MRDVETLKGLIAQVRAATVPSNDLDEAIHAALLPDDPWWQAIVEGRRLVAEGREDAVIDRCNCHLRADTWAKGSKVSSYTESIDDALRLVGKALPDARISLDINEAFDEHRVHTAFVRPQGKDESSAYACATPALAVCAGLLFTLIAQAQEAPRHGE